MGFMEMLKKYELLIVVFITGAAVLIIEIVATRVLSPYFGNTIFTFSSVIGVVLAALSLGYYFGGRLADKHPSPYWFYNIILISGFSVFLLQLLSLFFLPSVGTVLSMIYGPLFSAIILFLLPSFFLGMLSPFAIKLQNVRFPERGIGIVSGEVFFCSTIGSIFGSLMAGFYLIPTFGVQKIIVTVGITLIVISIVGLGSISKNKKYLTPEQNSGLKRWLAYTRLFTPLEQISRGILLPPELSVRLRRTLTSLGNKRKIFIIIFAAFVMVMVILFLLSATSGDEKFVYSQDGIYEYISIYDDLDDETGESIRFFMQDRSMSGAMFLASDELVFDYTKYYSIYPLFKQEIKNALFIGGGAYSVPKALLNAEPEVQIDVVEIEPSLFDLGKEFFNVPDTPRLKNYVADGRQFLQRTEKKYDLIFSDVYYSLFSIPIHFTTNEFFYIAKEGLTQDGVFVANIIGDLSRQHPSLVLSEIRTFQSVFPNSYFFAVNSPRSLTVQNIIFVGYNSDRKIDFDVAEIKNSNNLIIRGLSEKLIDAERFNLLLHPELTDNFAPVEHMMAYLLKRRGSREGENFDGKEALALIGQQLSYGPRFLGSSGHEKVKFFIIKELETLSHDVEVQNWKHVSVNGDKEKMTNIIARFWPEKDRRIILGTHYDSKRFSDKDRKHDDLPVPGANDSASGVAVLLEVARFIANNENLPNVGIDFVFFDGEEGEKYLGEGEWSPLGSVYFSENLSSVYSDKKPEFGIIVDMVCDKNLNIHKEELSLQYAEKYVNDFWAIANDKHPDFFLQGPGPKIEDDHLPLNKAGIPSFLIIDFDYPHFHTTRDTLDKCSGDSLEGVADSIAEYIYSI